MLGFIYRISHNRFPLTRINKRMTKAHLILLTVLDIHCQLAFSEGQENKPAWQTTIDEIRHITVTTSTGRNLKPDSWPKKARVAVLFSLDVDNQSEVLSRGAVIGYYSVHESSRWDLLTKRSPAAGERCL